MPRTLRRYGSGNSLFRKAATQAFTIYHVTDTHIWSAVGEDPNAPGAVGGAKLFYTVPQKLRKFVAACNADRPDLVLHTGDITEIDGDFAYFRTIWDTLDPTLNIAIVPGNHDYTMTADPGKTKGQTIADRLGYGTDPMVAGSRFHKSRSYTAHGVSIRLITIDTELRRDEVPEKVDGRLTTDTLAWIAAELAASPEDLIFLASHHSPHQAVNGWFNEAEADALQAIVDAECAARPSRRIVHLFGHRHGQQAVSQYTNRGPNYRGILPPVLLEYTVGGFGKYHVFRNGQIIWETGQLPYVAP